MLRKDSENSIKEEYKMGLDQIKKDLEASVTKGRNKLKIVKHNESIEYEDMHTDKQFQKSILG